MVFTTFREATKLQNKNRYHAERIITQRKIEVSQKHVKMPTKCRMKRLMQNGVHNKILNEYRQQKRCE